MAGLRPERVEVVIPTRATSLDLLVHLPHGIANGSLWPTVLYLHGGSHRGSDIERLFGYGPPRLAAEGADLPFILLAPQLPEGEIWTDADLLINLIDELSGALPIDPDRVYVTGMSMGARGAWYLAFRYPDRIAAIAPVATFQPITYWATSGCLDGLAIRAVHGERDEIAPLADIAAMNGALLARGAAAELEVLPDRDHFIADAFDDPRFYEWLLRQRRRVAAAADTPCSRSQG